ncbi:hypothetical protein OG21DRAFT_1486408 [Imleria badia]|nr:hypothetical protein OG21DRAFT_1486408 [Imleria badia]
MLPAVADSDQDFEQEVLSLFRLGNLATGSDPSSANETDSGLNSFANSPQSFDNNPLPLASDNLGFPVPDTTSSTGGNDFYSLFFNMDLDDTFDASFLLPPPNLSLQDLPLPNLPLLHLPPAGGSTGSQDYMLSTGTYSPPFTAGSHAAHASARSSHDAVRMRSPIPFSFYGGAPCILPPPPTTGPNVISLNLDDELDNPTRPFKYHHHTRKVHDSDSSHPSKNSAQVLSHSFNGSKPAPVLSTPPTSTHENMSSSSHQSSAAKGKCAQGSSVAMASEWLAKQADELIAKGTVMVETLHDNQARCCNARYNNKKAERSHQQWMAQFNANHEKSMAQLRLQQLEY